MTDLSPRDALTLEGLRMTSEATSAAMILLNARVAMLAEHVGLDISTPPLSEAEEENKNNLLTSVAKRVMKLIQMSAEIDGLPVPTPAEAADKLEQIKDEIWPEGSVSGTKSPSERVLGAIEAKHPGSKVVQSTVPPDLDDETADQLAEAIKNAEPVDMSEFEQPPVFKSVRTPPSAQMRDNPFDNPGWLPGRERPVPDMTDIIAQQQAAEEPLFKDEPYTPGEYTFTVSVLDAEDFAPTDFRDQADREKLFDRIRTYHLNMVDGAVATNWLSEAMAERIRQEINLSAENPVITSELKLPEPAEVTTGVAQTAAAGEKIVHIDGIDNESQVVEALMTAFMISAARFDVEVSKVFFKDRLSQIGMSPD